MLSRILSINNIYESLVIATELEEEIIIWFDSGRLFRIFMIFPPVELEEPEEDWYYNVKNNPYYYYANNYPIAGFSAGGSASMVIQTPGVTQPIVFASQPSVLGFLEDVKSTITTFFLSPVSHNHHPLVRQPFQQDQIKVLRS